MLKRALIVVAVLVVLVALLLLSQIRTTPFHVSGFIEAHDIRLGSRVGGRVADVLAQEGDSVSAGQTIIRLAPYDLTERLAQANADLAEKQAALDKAVAGFRPEEIDEAKAHRDRLAATLERLKNGPRPQEIEAARARLESAQAELTRAKSDFSRTQKSFQSGAATQFEMDAVTQSLQSAQANVNMRKAELDLLLAGTRKEEIDEARASLAEADAALALLQAGTRKEDVEAARASVAAATAARDAIQQQIDELAITAPRDAVIDALDLRPGDIIAPNAPVLTLIDPTDLWVRAYVPENHLDLQLGQHVSISTDSYRGRRFPARITFIARQGEFTPSNIQTPEERSKQVFRIKVTLDAGQDILRPGMAADVWFSPPTPAEVAADKAPASP